MRVSQRFDTIPLTTVLDGNGYGYVQFQVNGNNARITNLFVKVSTATRQSVCTIYKGQIADGNALDQTNSGSSGATAKGKIDILDGESVFIAWSGGVPGATATATVTGHVINFGDISSTDFVFSDPIAAGDGSLIYPALKSPDYLPGSTGWMISRDGSAEFNNVDVRGQLFVSGSGTSYIFIWAPAGAPTMNLNPDSTGAAHPSPISPARIQASLVTPSQDRYVLELQSPDAGVSSTPALLQLYSSDYTNSIPAKIGVSPDLVNVNDDLFYMRGQAGIATTASIALGATSFSVTVILPTAFPNANYHVFLTVRNANSGNAGFWTMRTNAIAAGQFDIVGTRSSGTGAAITLNIDWLAISA